jgi:hypothetical protein
VRDEPIQGVDIQARFRLDELEANFREHRERTDARLSALDECYRERLGHDESLHGELAAVMSRVLYCEGRLTECDAADESPAPVTRKRSKKGTR